MERVLSDQQREFCRLVARGLSGREAYAQAFGCAAGSAGSAASRMLKRVYIREEINRLSAAAREIARQRDAVAVGDRVERMQMLWQMARDARDAGEVADAVRCIAELNRMDGCYEPERVQVAAVSCSFDAIMEGLLGRPGNV